MVYLQLFLAFLQIGAFSFGGGYAAMPLIQAQVIERYGWMNPATGDLVTIPEMTPWSYCCEFCYFCGESGGRNRRSPGGNSRLYPAFLYFCNSSGLCIYKIPYHGAPSGNFGIPSQAVVAMIATAGLTILIPAFFASGSVSFANGNFQIRPVLYFLAALFLLRKKKIDPIKVMVGCGVAEAVVQVVQTFT